MIRLILFSLFGLLFCPALFAAEVLPLPGTQPLTEEADFSDRMLSGFENYLRQETQDSIAARAARWQRDFASADSYVRSIEPNRQHLARLIGVVDPRLPFNELQYITGSKTPLEVARTEHYTIYAVRWPVLEGVDGEGLLLVPRGELQGRVICLPDADQTPEMIVGLAPGLPAAQQYARHLAENGQLVIVPVLINRQDTWSGDPQVWMTNQPHREWVYRPAFELGRHIIGYEVQKVLALVDWCQQQGDQSIGIFGYGEGGLIGFYSAALDTRIDVGLVSGYFDSRQDLWEEPIYRNVFGLLTEFGDAEIASLIAPRPLIVEFSAAPDVSGPPAARDARRDVAAPGRIRTPALAVVEAEIERARQFTNGLGTIQLIKGADATAIAPGSSAAVSAFLAALTQRQAVGLMPGGEPPLDQRQHFDPAIRQQRQVMQLVDHTQRLLQRSERVRQEYWSQADTSSIERWEQSCENYREQFWNEVLGRCPTPQGPFAVRSRQTFDRPTWTGYEVVLEVAPEIMVWGYLLVPKNIQPTDRRPVVVCQHGLEGLPLDVITDDPNSQGYTYYKAFAARLAERGYVTFAPHHYYRGGDRFRQAQRLAYPLKKTLFALTIAQHEALLQWLGDLPFVDRDRIGFYGLSYGGFSAMRLPSIVKGYALSIDSAEFNDMALKKASVHDQYSYPFHRTYEVFEWNMANTFGYADMAGLIAPRPFMVERGHQDGVAPDEWVAAEYAKVRRLYTKLGISERTEIEFFDGPHSIHGVGTFQFLDRHLRGRSGD